MPVEKIFQLNQLVFYLKIQFSLLGFKSVAQRVKNIFKTARAPKNLPTSALGA